MGNLTSAFHVKNIETVNLDILAGPSTINATNWTGIKTISNKGAGDLTLTNVTSLDTAIKLDGTASNANIGFLASVVSGTSDLATVKLAKTTNGTLTMDAGVETLKLVTTAGEANTLNELFTANKTVQITGGGEIKIAGAANAIKAGTTTVDARDTAKATLNHANGAGVAILTGAGNDTVKLNTNLLGTNLISMGAGEDTLVLDGAANAAGVVTGVENVKLTAVAASLDMANFSAGAALDFQNGGTLTVTNAKAGTTIQTSTDGTTGDVSIGYAASVMDQALVLDLNRDITATSTLNFTNISDITVDVGRTGTQTFGAVTLDATANGSDVTKKFTLDATGAGTALTVGAIGSATTVTDMTLKASGNGSSVATGAVTASALKNLTIHAANGGATLGAVTAGGSLDAISITVGAGGLTAAGALDIAATNAAGISTIALNAAGGNIGASGANNELEIQNTSGGIKAVTATGSGDIYLDLVNVTTGKVDSFTSTGTGTSVINITNIDATGTAGTTVILGNAAAGKTNTLTITGDRNDTVTGGTGADTITTGLGDDIINGGAGNDTINGGAGADKMTGGAGNDKFIFTASGETKNALFSVNDTTAANIDHITDFVGNGVNDGDSITFTAAGFAGITAGQAFTLVNKTVASADSFAQLATTLNADVVAPIVASSGTVNSVALVTVSGGTLAGKYLISNDTTAAIDFTLDAIINVTGITGTFDVSDFVIA
ncbi:hypothetical protein NG754_10415 [Aliarcobacter cryaerophilus]|uniref:beta strand repeat-containing protein n=1 Tax=Aliarcobacter cryaerophilus TaxID=28198 RepID=UPI003DA4B137